LPKLQQILIQDGYAPDHIVWPSYLALWRAAAGGSRQRLVGLHSAVEDRG